MKTILFHQHGGPEVLKYTDFPTLEPKTGEPLIKLKVASLNHIDVSAQNGWPGLHLEFPHKNGDYVVINANLGRGRCEDCLSGWNNVYREWNLLCETVRGTYAEFVSLPERRPYLVPMDFDFHAAASAALSIRSPGILLLFAVISTPEKLCLSLEQVVV
jgi:NADPH:quinone reductase-like Zn-dependent oxidoreductase